MGDERGKTLCLINFFHLCDRCNGFNDALSRYEMRRYEGVFATTLLSGKV